MSSRRLSRRSLENLADPSFGGSALRSLLTLLYLPLRSFSRRFWIGVKSIQSGRLIQRYSLSFLLFASGGKSSCGRSSRSDPTLGSSVLARRKAIFPSSDRKQLIKNLSLFG